MSDERQAQTCLQRPVIGWPARLHTRNARIVGIGHAGEIPQTETGSAVPSRIDTEAEVQLGLRRAALQSRLGKARGARNATTSEEIDRHERLEPPCKRASNGRVAECHRAYAHVRAFVESLSRTAMESRAEVDSHAP